jgi:hypothetical protein
MKNSNFTKTIDMLLIGISFIIFLIATIVMKDTIIIKYHIEHHILQNLIKEPIMSISVGRNECDDDYEKFYDYSFPGVNEGSFDPDTSKLYDIDCSLSADPNCINIPELLPKDLQIWRDKVLCLQRFSEGSLNKTYEIIRADENCPYNTRQCGYYNKFLDKMCFINDVTCPVNYLSIERQPRKNDTKYTSIYLTNNSYLVYTTEETEQIIPIDFIVSDYTPCIETDRVSYNPNVGYFPLIANSDVIGCNRTDYDVPLSDLDIGYDYRYKILDAMRKKQFLIGNDLFKKYSTLPDLKGIWDLISDLQSKVYLFIKGYNSISLKCINHNDFENFENNLYTVKLFNFEHLCGCLFNLITICLLISVLSAFKFEKKYRYMHLTIQYVKVAFSMAFVAFNFSFACRGIRKILSVAEFLNMSGDPNCVDDELIYAYKRYSLNWYFNNASSYLNLFYVFAGLYTLCICLQLIRLIYKTYKRIKRTNKAKDQLIIK